MMSVIVKTPENKIMLYCKGADTVLFEKSKNKSAIPNISKVVQHYSVDGLRTLVMGYRELTEKEFNEWHVLYKAASIEMKNREKSIALAADKIEREIILIGCTGIEDKLQEGVPETIDYFLQAGLQVWVLTGDKVCIMSFTFTLK
jgi:magnesium-transporting ATPase (P-type)